MGRGKELIVGPKVINFKEPWSHKNCSPYLDCFSKFTVAGSKEFNYLLARSLYWGVQTMKQVASRWFLAWLILQPCGWRRCIPPKRRLTSDCTTLYPRTGRFITTPVRISYPSYEFIFTFLSQLKQSLFKFILIGVFHTESGTSWRCVKSAWACLCMCIAY
jgi:hypothetical protein